MTNPIVIPSAFSADRRRLLSMNVIRRRALDRLYQRRAAVDGLIRSLEDYQRMREIRVASGAPVIALEKWT
jgi:hypothetical protein